MCPIVTWEWMIVQKDLPLGCKAPSVLSVPAKSFGAPAVLSLHKATKLRLALPDSLAFMAPAIGFNLSRLVRLGHRISRMVVLAIGIVKLALNWKATIGLWFSPESDEFVTVKKVQ